MHVCVETFQAFGSNGKFGNAEQRTLQFFRALALQDFRLQLAVGALQFVGARFDAPLKVDVRVFAVQGSQDVLGHVTQQRAVFVGIAGRCVVTLHHDGTAHTIIAAHRHAQPVLAVRPVQQVTDDAQLLPDRYRRTTHGLAVAQQGEGHAVGHFLLGEFAFRIGDVRVFLVNEVQEAHAAALVVVQHDVAVVCVHQRTKHYMDTAQHLRHFQVGAGQVGDFIQSLLQALGFFERKDARLRTRGIQRGHDQGLRQGQPRLALGITQWLTQLGSHRHARTAFQVVPAMHQQLR